MPTQTIESIRVSLSALGLTSVKGNKKTLKHRLATATRSAALAARPPPPPPDRRPTSCPYESLLVVDVEATCEELKLDRGKGEGDDGGKAAARLAFSYPNEIIEWPVILLQWHKQPCLKTSRRQSSEAIANGGSTAADATATETGTALDGEEDDDNNDEDGDFEWVLRAVDEYRSFVKPTWRPKLSQFCKDLTGISQVEINNAPTYAEMLQDFFDNFIVKHNLFTRENKTAWVSDGPWDLRDFIAKASFISDTPRPSWLAGPMIDLRLLASTFFSSLKKPDSFSSSSPSPSKYFGLKARSHELR